MKKPQPRTLSLRMPGANVVHLHQELQPLGFVIPHCKASKPSFSNVDFGSDEITKGEYYDTTEFSNQSRC